MVTRTLYEDKDKMALILDKPAAFSVIPKIGTRAAMLEVQVEDFRAVDAARDLVRFNDGGPVRLHIHDGSDSQWREALLIVGDYNYDAVIPQKRYDTLCRVAFDEDAKHEALRLRLAQARAALASALRENERLRGPLCYWCGPITPNALEVAGKRCPKCDHWPGCPECGR